MISVRAFVFVGALCYGALAIAQSGPAPSPSPNAACGRPSQRVGQYSRDNSARLDPACVEQTRKADECCQNPAQEKCGYKESNFGQRPQTEEERRISGIYQPAVNQSRDLVAAYNRGQAAVSICRSLKEKRKATCAAAAARAEQIHEDITRNGDAPLQARETAYEARLMARTYSEIGDQDLNTYQSCHEAQNRRDWQDLQASVGTANSSLGEFDGGWRVHCRHAAIAEEKAAQCYLQNRSEPTGDMVRGSDRDDLPVRAVPVHRGSDANSAVCTGYTDETGQMSTAGHCPQDSRLVSIRDGQRGPEGGAWDKKDSLPFKVSDIHTGAPYSDRAVYDPISQRENPEGFKGKPFYHLAADPTLASGCEARGNILACSPAALNSIQGTRAEIQGFPAEHFSNPNGGTQNPRDTILLTRGPAYYDPYSGTINSHAYVAPGNSGGPLYFREGTNIGGYVADRPIVAGPVSAVQWTGRDAITGRSRDGGSYVYTGRTTTVPIASYTEVSRLYIPRVQNDVLLRGGSIFITPSGPSRGTR